ncbi:phage major tail tube protein [Pseudogemmobacter blasticus]|uniref:Phage major tail tube protein n=1 Tax=Fuscovulum blasticum DSM 2131 TaxID=1188250 RepID=A0A2T4JDF2_FUSBL|nr:phage major tail tube protein [Fuscovulum blasticum]PTE15911.1 phage major tail tube protein [Fuscovulum blasticum DSM 2131]
MALPRIIKNFNAFVDGISYFGLASEAKLPAVKVQTEGHRGAGMDGPVGVDVGMEALSAEITFTEWSSAVLKKLGRTERFVLRPAAGSSTDFSATTIIATMSGLITVSEPSDLKPGTAATLKIGMDVRTYKLEMDNEVIYEIDLVNAIRRIGGVDQLAEIRRAMGF